MREHAGRSFSVDDVEVRLFKVSVLAEAIDRKQRRIVDWERAGIFPRPMYTVPGSNYKRWYSEGQILMANAVWQKHREKGKSRHFDLQAFLQEINDQFYQVDLQRALNKEKRTYDESKANIEVAAL